MTAPRIYSIEGNIGSGKTTIFNKLRKIMQSEKIRFIEEPVDIWQTIKSGEDDENILVKFYKNKEKYAFSFQIMAYLTFLKQIKKCIQENPLCEIIISERSIESGYNIFTKMAIDEKYMNDIELQIYQMMYQENPFKLSGIIYVNVEPAICRERIAIRAREGESIISLEYLEKCKKYHDEWLIESSSNEERQCGCDLSIIILYNNHQDFECMVFNDNNDNENIIYKINKLLRI